MADLTKPVRLEALDKLAARVDETMVRKGVVAGISTRAAKLEQNPVFVHPAYPAVPEGLYSVEVDSLGSIKTADKVTRADLEALGAGAKEKLDAACEGAQSVRQELEKQRQTESIHLEKEPSFSGSVSYTGEPTCPKWIGYDAATIVIGGDVKATEPGDYESTFVPRPGYCWKDGTKSVKRVQWSLVIEAARVPYQKGTLSWTGLPLLPEWVNYDEIKLDMGGTTKATEPGEYEATFTPKGVFTWEDNSTATKTVKWKIAKADNVVTLSKNELELAGDPETVSVTKSGTGAVSAETDNAGVATVVVEGTNVTVTPVDDGDTVVTVNVAGDDHFRAAQPKGLKVSVEIPPMLNLISPARIREIVQAGQAPNSWTAGDNTRLIELTGTIGILDTAGISLSLIALAFNHNEEIEGANTMHLLLGKNAEGKQIALCENNYNTSTSTDGFRMNKSETNAGGWNGSYMKTTIMPQYLVVLPEEWRSIVAECPKYTDNTGNKNTSNEAMTQTMEKAFLLSEWEAFGVRNYAHSLESMYQKQYEYFQNGSNSGRQAFRHTNETEAVCWWLRSAETSYATAFCFVNTDGSSLYTGAYLAYGLRPAFAVA